MKELLLPMANKRHGIIFMVSASFLSISLLLSIDWIPQRTFMENLTNGYVYYIEIFERTCKGYGRNPCTDPNLYFMFKYMMLIPMALFTFGVYGLLSDSEADSANA